MSDFNSFEKDLILIKEISNLFNLKIENLCDKFYTMKSNILMKSVNHNSNNLTSTSTKSVSKSKSNSESNKKSIKPKDQKSILALNFLNNKRKREEEDSSNFIVEIDQENNHENTSNYQSNINSNLECAKINLKYNNKNGIMNKIISKNKNKNKSNSTTNYISKNITLQSKIMREHINSSNTEDNSSFISLGSSNNNNNKLTNLNQQLLLNSRKKKHNYKEKLFNYKDYNCIKNKNNSTKISPNKPLEHEMNLSNWIDKSDKEKLLEKIEDNNRENNKNKENICIKNGIQNSNNDKYQQFHKKKSLALKREFNNSNINNNNYNDKVDEEENNIHNKTKDKKGFNCELCEEFYDILGSKDCFKCSRHRDTEDPNRTPKSFYDTTI